MLLISSLNIFATGSMTLKLTVLSKSTYQSSNNHSLICNDKRAIHTETKLKLNDPTPWTLITAIQTYHPPVTTFMHKRSCESKLHIMQLSLISEQLLSRVMKRISDYAAQRLTTMFIKLRYWSMSLST